jgi:hypothetical protein
MTTKFWLFRTILILAFVLGLAYIPVQAKEAVLQTGFDDWQASESDFLTWQRQGTRLDKAGQLALNPKTVVQEVDPYEAGTYYEGNFYNGGSYWVGEAISPVVPVEFDYDEMIPSWNAVTPAGTWVEILARAELNGRWTKWYNLGIWASGSETIQRHSVPQQADDDGKVAVDTLVITDTKAVADAFQLKVRLFTIDLKVSPKINTISGAYSTTAVKNSVTSAGNPANWNTLLAVPECSQMVYEGGNVWCSPTSTSMVVAYWTGYYDTCEASVRAAVEGIYDWVYGGTGNWPFNTAYAGTYGLQASVQRFTSMNTVEEWVAQGVPVIISISWGNGQLTGAPVNSSGGHLIVVVGFDAEGNPIVNDPAAATDEEVQRTYLRSELEAVWLDNSGGVVYLIHP